ncbi:undecaprenyl-diphosphate phosphatase [Streptomyces sp. NPDC052023]|uniref:undecaprenyl-diphosphate phosphatase n=1 Tax=Streptomyces sp. NPDC052023 TaxID=3365681 RepID=UPI0037CDB8CE
MSWFASIILGLVQGLTEFLPISSSAHLRLVAAFSGWQDPGAAFTAITQIGTETAVLIYFRSDIARIVTAWCRSLTDRTMRADPDARLGWMLIIGSLPIGVLGVTFKDQIEGPFRDLRLTAAMLIAMGVVLGVADRLAARAERESAERESAERESAERESAERERAEREVADRTGAGWGSGALATLSSGPGSSGPSGPSDPSGPPVALGAPGAARPSGKTLHDLTVRDGLIYGLCQAMALIPGVSRSGATTSGGLFMGYTRAAAARYCFLLAIPAVLASGLFELQDATKGGHVSWGPTALATLIAFGVGYAVIAWFMKFIETRSFMPFVHYRIALGVVIIALVTFGVISPHAAESAG